MQADIYKLNFKLTNLLLCLIVITSCQKNRDLSILKSDKQALVSGGYEFKRYSPSIESAEIIFKDAEVWVKIKISDNLDCYKFTKITFETKNKTVYLYPQLESLNNSSCDLSNSKLTDSILDLNPKIFKNIRTVKIYGSKGWINLKIQ